MPEQVSQIPLSIMDDVSVSTIALGVIIALIIIGFIWKVFKKHVITSILQEEIQVVIERRFKEDYENKLAKVFDKKAEILFNAMEERLYDEVHVISLWSSKKYDEALDFIGFDGSIKNSKFENPALKRVLLSCVSNTRKYRSNDLREQAYDAAKELLVQENNILTIRSFLEVAVRAKKYEKPMELYDDTESRKLISKDRVASSWMAPVLRRKKKFHDSAVISLFWAKRKDYQAVVGLAAALRDLGYFKSTHVWLQEIERDILASPFRTLSGAPKKVLNSYIANCIDADYAVDAVDAAKHLLSHSVDDVEIFTVCLLILELYEKSKAYKELRSKIIPLVEALPDEIEKKEDCQLILDLTAGGSPAENNVKTFIYQRLNDFEKMDYFKVTLLAYLLYKVGDEEKSIELLAKNRTRKGANGIAEHYLSIIYADKGAIEDAKHYIKASGEMLPKWVYLAEKIPSIRNNQTLLKCIREFKSEQEKEKALIIEWFVKNGLINEDDIASISNN